MNKPFIAELHDIGKLSDPEALKVAGLDVKGHTYHNFDFAQLGIDKPTSPSWWAQWSDDRKIKSLESRRLLSKTNDPNYEGNFCVLLTKLADTIASSTSRPIKVEIDDKDEEGEYNKDRQVEGVRLLWRPDYYQKEKEKGKYWAAFSTPDELKQMFAFVDQCQNSSEFFVKYQNNLQLRAEDISTPNNAISLGTHLDLTGKIFRVLRNSISLVDNNGKRQLVYAGQIALNLTEMAGGRWDEQLKSEWIFRLIKCRVSFPQSLVRLQDLNVLRLRQEKIKEIVEKQNVGGDVERQPYAVLFNTDDFFSIFLPKESILKFKDIVKPLLDEGFLLDYEELEAELNLITSTGSITWKNLNNKYGSREKVRQARHFELRQRNIGPELASEIQPPLCDLCQQRPGQPWDKDQVREWLCAICRKIRDMGEPAHAISDWEMHSKPLAWLKISLEQDLLLACLQRLFNEYVEKGPGMQRVTAEQKDELKAGFRPLATQMGFVEHYKAMLTDFRAVLSGLKDTSENTTLLEQEALLYPVQDYNELVVVRLDNPQRLGHILDIFREQISRYFPACTADNPIRLSVSLGNAKYPYQEHWRFFSEKQVTGQVFHLQQPGIRQVRLTIPQYNVLRDKLDGTQIAHILHRLSEIEAEAGEITAMVEALQEKRLPFQELVWQHKINFTQILDFYRLVTVATEGYKPNGD